MHCRQTCDNVLSKLVVCQNANHRGDADLCAGPEQHKLDIVKMASLPAQLSTSPIAHSGSSVANTVTTGRAWHTSSDDEADTVHV